MAADGRPIRRLPMTFTQAAESEAAVADQRPSIALEFRLDVEGMYSVRATHFEIPNRDALGFTFILEFEEGPRLKVLTLAGEFAHRLRGKIEEVERLTGYPPQYRITIPYGNDLSLRHFWILGQDLSEALVQAVSGKP